MRPTHREFKVLLRGDRFREGSSLHAVQTLLAHTARAQSVPLDKAPVVVSRVRMVELFDTPAHHLRTAHRILRRRQVQDTGWASATSEVTYKVRSDDRARCTEANLRATAGHTAGPMTRIQFREEILPGPTPGTTRSLWSHNVILDTPALPLPGDVGTLAETVPDVAALGLPGPTTLERVGRRHVVEVGAVLGALHLGRQTVAHADVTVWRLGGEPDAFVAEAGFTYHVLGEVDAHPHVHERADRFFVALVAALDAWRTDIPTKTQALYDLATRDAAPA